MTNILHSPTAVLRIEALLDYFLSMHSTLGIEELLRQTPVPIISFVNSLISRAHDLRASDIHIEPRAEVVCVRLRIDGSLNEFCFFPKGIHAEVLTRLKVLGNLRTDEHHTPQDGRFSTASGVDIRLSVVPSYHGETLVLRLLREQGEAFTFDSLGLSESDSIRLSQAIQKPHGMILASGPTGSGKTTTLYTLLKLLKRRDVSLVTIEDPIEYAIDGITQIPVNARTGLSFAQGLRSILRQDPDGMMVGEIRDPETARLAVNAALTGHLVLSTLHTSDAAATVVRFLDLGIEPYLIAATLGTVIGQRLVRKLCHECRIQTKFTATLYRDLPAHLQEFFSVGKTIYERGNGCAKCSQTGFHGRVGISEVMGMSEVLRKAVLERASSAEIRAIAIREGMTPMIADGCRKVIEGMTTIEEILRVFDQ